MSAYKKFAYDLRLDGKVAVVTGGTSGIGQETARMLAWKGATVIIFGRNPKIHEIAAQLGPKVTGINVDITQTTQIAAAVDQVIKMNGAIDILVNSAGIGSGKPAEDISEEEFMNVFRVVIQLGAILAVLVLYFRRLNPFDPGKKTAQKRATWHLWFKIIIACLPAAVVGILIDKVLD